MGNLLSSRGTSRTLQVSIVGVIAVVGWAAHAKIWRKTQPLKAPLGPKWLDLFHRNHYGRRRLQTLNPNSEKHSMLRDFDLMTTNDSSSCVNAMRDYLGRREIPEHLRIAPEYILDTQVYRALVTPWYENGNILDFINKEAVGDGRKLDLIMQIAEGLEFLHGPGIVHGNVYPANILVTDDKDVVLTDAGIYTEVVRLMLSPSGRIPLPQSIVYKSRRELDGEEEPTESTDVYAFASTCYAVMIGQAPFFDIANPYQRVLKVSHPDGHRVLLKPLLISPMLWDLLMRCWSPEPAQRPTMDDIVYCLGRVKYYTNRRSLLTGR